MRLREGRSTTVLERSKPASAPTAAANYGGPFLTTVIGRPGNPQTFVLQLSWKF